MCRRCVSLGMALRLTLLTLCGMNLGACGGEPQEHPDMYVVEQATKVAPKPTIDTCTSPSEGCPCENPGEIIDCGRVSVKVDDYETCFDGSRLCNGTGKWGACEPDSVIAETYRQGTTPTTP
jgi:hypothetical protein